MKSGKNSSQSSPRSGSMPH